MYNLALTLISLLIGEIFIALTYFDRTDSRREITKLYETHFGKEAIIMHLFVFIFNIIHMITLILKIDLSKNHVEYLEISSAI